MPILDRYLFREILLTFIGVISVLLLILMSNKFSRFLGEAAAGNLPRETIFELLAYSAIGYLVILIPIALFISILLTVGRLYQDSEMSSMTACGIGPWQLYRPILLLAIIVSALLAFLSTQVAPWAARTALEIRNSALADAQLNQLEPGKFLTTDNGNLVFYADAKSDNDELQKVFLQQTIKTTIDDLPTKKQELILAEQGSQQDTDNPQQKMFVLNKGTRYLGKPGQKNYEIIKFAEHGIPIQVPAQDSVEYSVEELPLNELNLSNAEHQAEWQWRWSIPLSAVLLAFLALPMSKTSPRQGRFGKVTIAILFYIVYANLLALAKAWVVKSESLYEYGLWWVHLIILGIVIVLLLKQYGLQGLFGNFQRAAVSGQQIQGQIQNHIHRQNQE